MYTARGCPHEVDTLIVSAGSRAAALLASVVIAFSSSSAIAGMENAKFCLHRKPAFVSSKNAPVLCDDPATASVEPNYSPNFENLPCDQYTVNAPLGPSTVYVVVADAGEEGVAAVSFGVDYFGSDPDGMPATGDETGILSSRTTFTMCANGLAFPDDNGYGDFPAKGGGIRITWNTSTSCEKQTIGTHGVHAVVGSFYIYAYSSADLNLTPNNGPQGNCPELAVADCTGKTTDLFCLLGSYGARFIMGVVHFDTSLRGGFNPCLVVVPVQRTTWGRIKHQYK